MVGTPDYIFTSDCIYLYTTKLDTLEMTKTVEHPDHYILDNGELLAELMGALLNFPQKRYLSFLCPGCCNLQGRKENPATLKFSEPGQKVICGDCGTWVTWNGLRLICEREGE